MTKYRIIQFLYAALFILLDLAAEVKLTVELNVKKTSGVFLLDFQTEGFVIVPCDRCLDEMELPVSTSDKLKVKLGSSFAEEGDIVVVPEEDGYINIAWF